VRGDRISWLQASWPAAARYLALMEALRQALNQVFFLGLDEYEAHYACYEPGGFYLRHVDRHATATGGSVGVSDVRGQRVISTVCYLNAPGWPADAGGELVLYPAADTAGGGADAGVRVRPEGGTLVVFRSDTLPHEVLAADRRRLSIAGWMRTRAG
ncbi:2OG-Fe(II) oxygenase, partial [Acinetobacter baumannii]